MCVVSMIMDHYNDRWTQPQQPVRLPWMQQDPPLLITKQELAEFRKLLDRAREYDKRMGEPDCELEEKKAKVLALAEELMPGDTVLNDIRELLDGNREAP